MVAISERDIRDAIKNRPVRENTIRIKPDMKYTLKDLLANQMGLDDKSRQALQFLVSR